MASGKSQYLEQALLNFLYRGVTFTPPATAYLALSTLAWDPSLDGSSIAEPVGGAYARVAIACNTSNWTAAAGTFPAEIDTANDVAFPTATGDWGLIQSVYLTDAASAGNTLHGADVTPTAIGTGSSAAYLAGQLVAQES